MDCSLPGSSVHGILQARILDWVAISFSRGSSQCRDGNCVSYISCIANSISVTCLKGLTSYAPSYNSPINKGRIILSIYHVTGKSGLKKKSLLPEESEPSTNWNWGLRGGRESVHALVCCRCDDITACCAQRCERSWADPCDDITAPCAQRCERSWAGPCDDITDVQIPAMTSRHPVPRVVSAHGQIPVMTSRHPVPSVVSAHGQIPAMTSRPPVPGIVSAHGQIPAMTSRHACCAQCCERSWADPCDDITAPCAQRCERSWADPCDDITACMLCPALWALMGRSSHAKALRCFSGSWIQMRSPVWSHFGEHSDERKCGVGESRGQTPSCQIKFPCRERQRAQSFQNQLTP